MNKEDFKDIAPFDDCEFKDNMAYLIKQPGFEHAVKYVLPMVDYPSFCAQLMTLETKNGFQRNIMAPFLEMLANKTTSGLSIDGLQNLDKTTPRTYLSNHRDIVLDASFLNVCLLRHDFSTCAIALGDNLLIYDWIERLVKLNKGFIVKRNLKMLKAFEAAKQLSGYIHYCLSVEKESVWIAQREGRAKDSNDRTQEGVLKMLALDGGSRIIDSLLQVNICPTTISYEYDPNDFLKAKEFLFKRDDPHYKKSQRDDLLSMETGLLGFKGNVHYHISKSINPQIEELCGVTDKVELFSKVAAIIDRQIHLGYKIYPVNYISYDRVNRTTEFADRYTDADVSRFDAYLDGQLAKVDIENLKDEDKDYMRQLMLVMYSNPLKNKLIAQNRLK